MKCLFVFGTRLNLSGNDFFKNKCDHRWKSGQRWKKNLWMGATFLKRPPTNLWYRALWSVGQKRKKGKKIFFVFLMINLNKLYFLVGHNYWKKIKKSDYQKCNHACIMHVLTAIIYTNMKQYVNYVYIPHLYNKYITHVYNKF
jgi:hypothetical protein